MRAGPPLSGLGLERALDRSTELNILQEVDGLLGCDFLSVCLGLRGLGPVVPAPLFLLIFDHPFVVRDFLNFERDVRLCGVAHIQLEVSIVATVGFDRVQTEVRLAVLRLRELKVLARGRLARAREHWQVRALVFVILFLNCENHFTFN